MFKLLQKPKGFIAMLSVLIVTTIAMTFAISILADGIVNSSLSLNSIKYEDARTNAIVCLEDVLVRMKQEAQFNQNLNYTISTNNSCSTTITWQAEAQTAPGIKERLVDLNVTGVSDNFTRNFLYSLKMAKYDVNNSDGSLDYMNTIDFVSIAEVGA